MHLRISTALSSIWIIVLEIEAQKRHTKLRDPFLHRLQVSLDGAISDSNRLIDTRHDLVPSLRRGREDVFHSDCCRLANSTFRCSVKDVEEIGQSIR